MSPMRPKYALEFTAADREHSVLQYNFPRADIDQFYKWYFKMKAAGHFRQPSSCDLGLFDGFICPLTGVGFEHQFRVLNGAGSVLP
jgi:hypothetical protein